MMPALQGGRGVNDRLRFQGKSDGQRFYEAFVFAMKRSNPGMVAFPEWNHLRDGMKGVYEAAAGLFLVADLQG